MKRVFQMKTMLFAALLSAIGFGAKAQIADATNVTPCTVIVRFFAVDAVTCTTIATDPGPYVIPTGGAPTFIPAAWAPKPPGVNYLIIAEVAFAGCGFPGVLVGPPPCGTPTAPLPACGSCGMALADNPGAAFPPGSGGVHYPINVHP